MLERIGRSRYVGEMTVIKNDVKDDPKSLFYIRKMLLNQNLIKKQAFCIPNVDKKSSGDNLVHLTRFFRRQKPKFIIWAEKLINYLKTKENYAAEYNEVKEILHMNYPMKKFFKITMMEKVFKTNVRVPYREYYPNATEKVGLYSSIS